MGSKTPRRDGFESRLFLVYAVASFVPVLLLGLILVRNDQHTGLAWGLQQGRAQAAVIEETAIAPALGSHDLAEGLSQTEVGNLRQATDLAVFSGSVTRLRVRSFSGGVVFSDDGSREHALSRDQPAFQAAMVGKVSADVITDPLDGAGKVIRVVQPITPTSTGQATGILEIYLPYGLIAHAVDRQLGSTYLRLAIGLGALYAVLALISWSSTRRLRRHAAERHYQALHDPLTGLPNREWFRVRADTALHKDECGALVLADLDNFKQVNDSLGHHAGDELLTIVAHRLSAALRTDDTVARLGGDEFGLLLPGFADSAQAVRLLEEIRVALAEEIVIDNVSLSIEASFGIAMYPEHGRSVEDLLKRADAAMYQGKRGTARIVVYEEHKAPLGSSGLILQGELRHAIDQDELALYYQPQIELVTGAVYGVEALVRWQHPTRGLIPPGDFVPTAELSGLIEPLTAWVLRRALADQREWSDLGVNWRVSVNVSARNLSSAAFAAQVFDIIAAAGANPRDLCLEVTETALTTNAEAASASVAALSNAGVAISIDDFGTGYTSLWQVRSLPVDEVKIDRTFVKDVSTSEADRSIVQAIIGLSHGLGCTVTAEGVESEAAALWLKVAGCDSAQGYHYARPKPWQELLSEHHGPVDAGGTTPQDSTEVLR